MSDLRQRLAQAIERAAEFDSYSASTAQTWQVADEVTTEVQAIVADWLRERSAAHLEAIRAGRLSTALESAHSFAAWDLKQAADEIASTGGEG